MRLISLLVLFLFIWSEVADKKKSGKKKDVLDKKKDVGKKDVAGKRDTDKKEGGEGEGVVASENESNETEKEEEKEEVIPKYIPRILHIKENNHDLAAKLTPCYVLYYNTSEKSLLMKKKFEKAIEKVGKFGVTIAELNCTKYPEACKNKAVKRKDIPLLRSYHTGTPTVYDGEPVVDEIVTWIEKGCEKGMRVFPYKEAIEELVFPDFEHVTIGFFPDRQNIEYTTYASMAHTPKEGEAFTAVVNKSIEKARLIHIHTKSNYTQKYKGQWDWAKIVTWNGEMNSAFTEELTADNFRGFQESRRPVGWLFQDIKTMSMDATRREYEKLGRKYKGKVTFVIVDKNVHGRLAQAMGLSGKFFPSFTIVAPYDTLLNPEGKARYPLEIDRPLIFPDDVNTTLEQYVQDFLDGKLKPTIRSEKVDEEDKTSKGGVVYITGSTFNETVLDKTKNVFIRFIHPWCSKCKRLKIPFDELAAELKERASEKNTNNNLLLADFDVTKNDHPAYVIVKEFPSLFLFTDKNKIDYMQCEEVTSIQKIRKWLKENIQGLDIKVDEEVITREDEEEKRREKMARRMGQSQGNKDRDRDRERPKEYLRQFEGDL